MRLSTRNSMCWTAVVGALLLAPAPNAAQTAPATLPAGPSALASPPVINAPRTWSFPGDHGQHPEFANEWWYLSGNLSDGHGASYGYQFTIFRYTISPAAHLRGSKWATRDIFVAHAAVSDAHDRQFRYSTMARRPHLGMAAASEHGLEMWVGDWRLAASRGCWSVAAACKDFSLRLELQPAAEPCIHGKDGYVTKGNAQNQASYYYSITRLETSGTIAVQGRSAQINGQSWFDHDFGYFAGERSIAGSDWFGLQLADGTDIMVYRLRMRDGNSTTGSLATIRQPDGICETLAYDGFVLTPLTYWTSDQSGARYPARCRLQIPQHSLDLEVAPLLADQELRIDVPMRINYWEGAVTASGLFHSRRIEGRGYCEFTGYDRDKDSDHERAAFQGR